MFSPELALTVRSVLIDVVEGGTAARLAHAIVQRGRHADSDRRQDRHRRPSLRHFLLGGRDQGIPRGEPLRHVCVLHRGPFLRHAHRFRARRQTPPITSSLQSLSAQILKYLLPTLKPLIDTARPLPEPIRQEQKHEKKAAMAEPSGDEAIDATQPSEPVE